MRVYRAPRRFDVVTVARAGGLDERLSAEARGVLFYVMVQDDEWSGSVPDIGKANKCGRDKMERILRELRDAGYAALIRRSGGGPGQAPTSVYEFSDRPVLGIVATPSDEIPRDGGSSGPAFSGPGKGGPNI